MEIRGRSAVVTGAGSGIGRACALALGAEGARLVLVDVDESGNTETARLVREAGGTALALRADVTRVEDVRVMLARAREAYGAVDIVLNNAGVETGGAFPEADPDRCLKTIAVNLGGVILGTQAAMEEMAGRGGLIVAIASLAGLVPYPGDPVYAATKAGVVNFTRSLVPACASRGIRINCVCPAFVDTPLTGRLQETGAAPAAIPLITPSAVAEAVLHICRDDSLQGKCLAMRPGQEVEVV